MSTEQPYFTEVVGGRSLSRCEGGPGGAGHLNIHKIASLYVAFAAPEARRIARKLEFHLTPKHGSWLNVAESESAVLSSQCLNRRRPTLVTVRKEVAAWERQRNADVVKIHWLLTTAHARRKFRHAYPSRRNQHGRPSRTFPEGELHFGTADSWRPVAPDSSDGVVFVAGEEVFDASGEFGADSPKSFQLVTSG